MKGVFFGRSSGFFSDRMIIEKFEISHLVVMSEKYSLFLGRDKRTNQLE